MKCQEYGFQSLHLTHILIQDSGHNYVECVRPTMDTKCEKFNKHALQWIGEIGDHLDRVVM